MTTPIKIAITPGEPAGIGPDLIIKLAQETWQAQLVVFADGDMLKARASALGLPLTLIDYDANNPHIQPAGSLYIKQIDKSVEVVPGTLDSENGLYVVETLRQACQANMDGDLTRSLPVPFTKVSLIRQAYRLAAIQSSLPINRIPLML